MFCHNCGKEIQDGVKFCTYCGKTQNVTSESINDKIFNAVGGKEITTEKVQEYAEKAKETAHQMADTVISSAKSVGEKVNEVTDGQAQAYTDKAIETAQNFADDVRQVVKDKNTETLLKKNKGCIILVVFFGLILLIAIIASVFYKVTPKGFDEAQNRSIACTKRLPGVEKVISSDCELVGYKSDVKVHMVVISVRGKLSVGVNQERDFLFLTEIDKDGKVKQVIFKKAAKSEDEKTAVIKEIKEHLKSLNFEIK